MTSKFISACRSEIMECDEKCTCKCSLQSWPLSRPKPIKIKIGDYVYFRSWKKSYHLFTEVRGRPIHFGYARRQYYFDKTGLLDPKFSNFDANKRLKFSIEQFGMDIYDPTKPIYHVLRVLN